MKRSFAVSCACAFFAVALIACGDDSSSTQAPDNVSSESSQVSSSSVVPLSSAGDVPETSSSEDVSSSAVSPASSSVPESSDALDSSSSAAPESSDAPASSNSGDDGKCTSCDSFTPADPELTENGGKGSVTVYGSTVVKETSLGGACNYGQTNIQYYAAIHVNVSPGDDKGPWDDGAACGGCVHVKARTPSGWKEVTVRITDKCPDANCGVDLGGAPAYDIMGNLEGRYSGEWEFVSCEGVEGVWGDSTSLWVKEGASKYWSIVQVRNPKDMVKSITIYGIDTDKSYKLEMVVGTENFWTVPQEVLQSDKKYRVVVKYRSGTDDEWYVEGPELAVGEANLYLYEHRE